MTYYITRVDCYMYYRLQSAFIMLTNLVMFCLSCVVEFQKRVLMLLTEIREDIRRLGRTYEPPNSDWDDGNKRRQMVGLTMITL